MTVEQEEKILKVLSVYAIFPIIIFNNLLKSEHLLWEILVPMTMLMLVLTFRKYSREKKQGKVIVKGEYFQIWGVIGLLLITMVTMFFIPDLLKMRFEF